MSSDLQHPWKKLGMAVCTYNRRSGEAETEGLGVELTAQLTSLGELMNSKFNERSCPQNKVERDGGYPVSTLDLHVNACITYVYTRTYICAPHT